MYLHTGLLGSSGSTASVTLLGNCEFDALALRQRDPRLVTLTNDEHIRNAGGKLAIEHVLDVNNLETANMTLTVGDNTNTTHVTTTSDSSDVADFEFDELADFASLKVEFEGIVHFDEGVRIAQCTTVVGNNKGDALGADPNLLDFEEFVFGLFCGDTVNGEAALDVVDEAEVLTSFIDGDDIHEASREGGVSPHLAVDLYKALHEDALNFLARQGILEAISQEDHKWQAFALFVGTS